MTNLLTWVASIAVIAYTGLGVLLYIGQRNLLYFPAPENDLVHENSVRWTSGSETIKIWRVGAGTNALLYFGGNAEDVAFNIPEFKQFFPDHTLYLVNYRGFGGSTGKPTEAGLYEDALNVYDRVNENHENISVMGRSLGSAVAVHLASKRDVKQLVLVTPFDSMLNMAKGMYPLYPVSLLLKDRFDSIGKIGEIGASILVLVAGQDGIIPRERTDSLIDAIPAGQIYVQVVENASHNTIQSSTDYADALISFIGNQSE